MHYEINIPELGHFYMITHYSAENQVSPADRDVVHVHDAVEFYILEEGDISFFVGGNVYNLTPGDVILAKPNETHYCIQNSICRHHYFCLWFSPACEVLLSDFLKHPDGEGNLIRLPKEEKKQLLSLCHKILDQVEAGKTVSAYSASVAALDLCRGAMYLFPDEQSLPEELISVLQTIETRMDSIASIKDLCEELFMSQSTLLRLFHRHLAVSPHEYLETRRLAMARTYLLEGKSVTETATLTGFSNTSVFIRLFHRRFGITPLKFKQSNHVE